LSKFNVIDSYLKGFTIVVQLKIA